MADALFKTDYVFPGVPGFVFRPLARDDVAKGYLGVLGQLSECAMDDACFARIFDELVGRATSDAQQSQGTTLVVVAEDTATRRVVLTGTLLVERKFLHAGGLVGHIEDIVVSKECRGKHLGQELIAALLGLAKAAGCYKVILDCKDRVLPFYEKCGLRYKDNCMAVYFREH